MVYRVMAAQAEFERAILSQRTKEGLAAARKRGKRLGRPKALSRHQLVEAIKMRDQGANYTDIAALFGVNRRTLATHLKAFMQA